MASSPTVPDAPTRAQGQKNFFTDQTFDRKTKTLFYVFSPFAKDVDYRTNCTKAEWAIADAINRVDRKLFSQLTDDNNGSELKFRSFVNHSKDGEARLFTKFELYSDRAVDLFRSAFPLNRRPSTSSNPAAATHRQFQYSWPAQRRTFRAREPQQVLMAFAIRGGQKLTFEALANALSTAGATLCSFAPIRGHGLNLLSLTDSLAIVRCKSFPKTITVEGKDFQLFPIRPVNPVDPSANAAGTSYAAAVATPTPAYAFQAWHALQAARSQSNSGGRTGADRGVDQGDKVDSAAGAAAGAVGHQPGGAGEAENLSDYRESSKEVIGEENHSEGISDNDLSDLNDSESAKRAAGGQGKDSAVPGTNTTSAAAGSLEDISGGSDSEVVSSAAASGDIGDEESGDEVSLLDPTGELEAAAAASIAAKAAAAAAATTATEGLGKPQTETATTTAAVRSPSKRKLSFSPGSSPRSNARPLKSPRKILAALRSPACEAPAIIGSPVTRSMVRQHLTGSAVYTPLPPRSKTSQGLVPKPSGN